MRFILEFEDGDEHEVVENNFQQAIAGACEWNAAGNRRIVSIRNRDKTLLCTLGQDDSE